MAAVNDLSQLNGLFKTVYADKILDLVPDFAILQKRVEFSPADKELGALYAQPVELTQEAGFTFLGESDALIDSDLNAAIAGQMKQAEVKGSQLLLRSQISYLALSRAASKGQRAFQRASAVKVEGMNNATRKRLEIAMLYGQSGLGTLSVDPGTGTTSYTLTFTDATWCPAIWVGSEGAAIDVFSSALTTRRNTAACYVTAVDVDNKQITVSATSTQLDTADAGDVVYWRGAKHATSATTFYEMAGLNKIITNTSSLFGIDASIYSLWKGTTVSSVGEPSHAKIQAGVSKAVNKGLMEKALVLVSPRMWGVLNTDQSALRAFDSSYKASKSENGSEGLVFHSTNGQIEVVSHPFVKEGDAFIVPEDALKRIGSVDLSFGVGGMDEEFFTLVPSRAAVEMQCMADQAIFLERPGHACKLTGITYSV